MPRFPARSASRSLTVSTLLLFSPAEPQVRAVYVDFARRVAFHFPSPPGHARCHLGAGTKGGASDIYQTTRHMAFKANTGLVTSLSSISLKWAIIRYCQPCGWLGDPPTYGTVNKCHGMTGCMARPYALGQACRELAKTTRSWQPRATEAISHGIDLQGGFVGPPTCILLDSLLDDLMHERDRRNNFP